MRWVTRWVSIDWRSEIFWPGTVEICTLVARLGHSSIHIDQDLLQEETSKATGHPPLNCTGITGGHLV